VTLTDWYDQNKGKTWTVMGKPMTAEVVVEVAVATVAPGKHTVRHLDVRSKCMAWVEPESYVRAVLDRMVDRGRQTLKKAGVIRFAGGAWCWADLAGGPR